MDALKFIHAADVHLDSPLTGLERYEGAPADEIRSASRRALENLVELAVREQVAFVLIAGDLYDGQWRDHNTGLFFVTQMVRLRDASIPVYVISGNHDAANKMTRSLPLPRNPDGSQVMLSHSKPETVLLDELGVAIHGRGFAAAKVAENVVDSYPGKCPGYFNIGMLHTSLDADGGEHARYAPCKLDDLRQKEYDYWALGHIHKRAVRSTEPLLVYPGNIQGRHIREQGAKGCMLVTVDQRGQAECSFRPLDVFRWELCPVAADGAEQGEDLLERFAAGLSTLIDRHAGMPLAVRVAVSGRCPAHQQLLGDPVHWTNQFRAAALDTSGGTVWVEKVRFQTAPHTDRRDAGWDDGPVGELLRYLDDLDRDEQLRAALADELADLRQKLPDDLKRGSEPIALDDPDQLRAVLREVEPLLIGELLKENNR